MQRRQFGADHTRDNHPGKRRSGGNRGSDELTRQIRVLSDLYAPPVKASQKPLILAGGKRGCWAACWSTQSASCNGEPYAKRHNIAHLRRRGDARCAVVDADETGPVKVADFTGLKRKKKYAKHFLPKPRKTSMQAKWSSSLTEKQTGPGGRDALTGPYIKEE